MDVTFVQLSDKDEGELVKFLTTNRFPFHRNAAPSEALVRQLLLEGRFESDAVRTFWLIGDNQRMGLVILEDLDGPRPAFDLRLVEEFRGHGYGVPIVKALAGHVFTTYPQTQRLAGRTRADNIAMRLTLLRAGFVKESHHRQAWELEDGPALDAVTYVLLRSDWEAGTVTGFPWEDLEEPSAPS
ncbi:hypothetical protein BN1051_00716 [Arthrobacter saudimassiliensis]|uniref:N-acetyltransferase domain-containing protein n=1 Tax=Arthrobacter saudimassiliensis TaxID=1461584 RepID=A0A078MJ41_9MICC|nr:hypothetical protein BN1051_00716 [Arthrobacter saudimassiliensis]